MPQKLAHQKCEWHISNVKIIGAAYKSLYYRPATRCKHCTNSHLKAKANTKFKIADGTIFTNLIVVKEVDPIKSDNNASRKRYEVKCTCGNYFITTGTGLRLGRITRMFFLCL